MNIGLTYTGSEAKHLLYCQWLSQHNPAIQIITLSTQKNNLNDIKICKGLVLSGGVDIHPSHYKGASSYPEMPFLFEPERDEFEIKTMNLALQQSLPILGICRGMQLINCVLGGNLKQDLGHQNQIHKASAATHVSPQIDKLHAIDILKETQLFTIAKCKLAMVNSAHHQTIDVLAKALKPNCTGIDGEVEGVEWNTPDARPFLMGVQWHPERMYQHGLEASPLSLGIRNLFITACNKL